MNAEQTTARAHPRTSVFVLATMVTATVSGPIKIRNMSSGGALVEGEALPCVGERVCLRRGDLAAAGRIVWREAGKAGLRFDDDVQVMSWLPTGNGKQQLVDRTFAELKSNPISSASSAMTNVKSASIDGGELLDLASALDALADDLAGDTAVVANHLSKLQTLDIASQLLRKIAVAKGSSGVHRDLDIPAAGVVHRL